ncbi:MAG: dockerin type I domain-containing protein, partial [Planctomycetota bacterium]
VERTVVVSKSSPLRFETPFVGDNGGIIIDSISVEEFVLGDLNCDGVLDLLDVEPFVNAISMSDYILKADINQDGVVDLLDVTPFVDLLTGG